MRVRLEEEATLIEDGFLGLPIGAVQHEFRKFLSPQQCGPIQDQLCRGRRSDLDHIVFASGGTGAPPFMPSGSGHHAFSIVQEPEAAPTTQLCTGIVNTGMNNSADVGPNMLVVEHMMD